MRRIVVATLMAMVSAGCLESNPQPAPEKSAHEVLGPGGIDVTESAADVGAEIVLNEDVGKPDISPRPDVVMSGDIQNTGECCTSDEECTGALACIGAGDTTLGTCQPKPNKFVCYDDSTCLEFYSCHNPQVCTCDMDCTTEAGSCEPVKGACCADDDDCPEGTRCVGGEEQGICLVEPDHPSKCWEDKDCDSSEVCIDAFWSGCGYMTTGPMDMGHCQDKALTDCVEKYNGCECVEGCADGFSSVVFYSEEAGEFPADINPPEELLAVGVAMYECAVCACKETWTVPVNGVWEDFEGGPEEFCLYLFELDEECGGCLTTWEGGCC